MLVYNEIKEKKFIVVDGDPHEVLSSHIFRKQQRKPVNAVKLRNILTGKVFERSYHQSEKAEEAEIDARKIKYLYSNRGEHWFCDEANAKNRFKLREEILGPQIKFLKRDSVIDGLIFNEDFIGVRMPIKVELAVTEAPPGIKGNTAQGGTKQVTLETGALINAPLFINEGDILRINTETGEYVERVQK